MQRSIAVLTALVLALVMAAASAHTGLRAATPADGSTIAESPKELVLEFSGQVRLTAVALVSAAGKKTEMAAIPTEAGTRFVLPISGALLPGGYVVTWRAVGADTHVVSGEVKFTLDAAAAPSATAASPAAPAPASQKGALPDPEPTPSGVKAPR